MDTHANTTPIFTTIQDLTTDLGRVCDAISRHLFTLMGLTSKQMPHVYLVWTGTEIAPVYHPEDLSKGDTILARLTYLQARHGLTTSDWNKLVGTVYLALKWLGAADLPGDVYDLDRQMSFLDPEGVPARRTSRSPSQGRKIHMPRPEQDGDDVWALCGYRVVNPRWFSTDWSQVTCKQCLKQRPKETESR